MTNSDIRVSLVSSTRSITETLLVAWQQSRSHHELLTTGYLREVREAINHSFNNELQNYRLDIMKSISSKYFTTRSIGNNGLHKDVSYKLVGDKYLLTVLDESEDELIPKIINSSLPVAETISFTFCIENYPLKWREQAVRTRTGAYWLQTSRITDYADLYSEDKYHTPEAILDGPFEARQIYHKIHQDIQHAYNQMIALGIKGEDASSVLPRSTVERGEFTYDLRTLKGVIGKRSCWVAQGDIWNDIISKIIEVIYNEDKLIASALGNPPCISKSCFSNCPFKLDMDKRMTGQDPLEPCPIYLKNYKEAREVYDKHSHTGSNTLAATEKRLPLYTKIWSAVDKEIYTL